MLHKLKNEKGRVWFKRMVSNLLSLKMKQNQTLQQARSELQSPGPGLASLLASIALLRVPNGYIGWTFKN